MTGNINLRRAVFALVLLALPFAANADAGKVLFVYGKAQVESDTGTVKTLAKDAAVMSGDTIVTGVNGRVQLQMSDGGMLALKPNTEFQIEEFNNPYLADGSRDRAAGEPRSFYALLKGGFRSITGAVGKEDKSAYRVRTPVATIGIRGTDYTAVYCVDRCGSKAGLFVSVLDGGVSLSNDAGALNVDAGDFGYVRDIVSAPEAASATGVAAASSSDDEEESEEEAEAPAAAVASMGTDNSGAVVNLTDGGQEANSGAVVFAAGPLGSANGFTDTAEGESANVVSGANGLESFTAAHPDAASADYSAGTTTLVGQVGFSESTGLSWGRWASGTVSVVSGTTDLSENLNGSLHWMTSDGARPTVPSAGTASFRLIGDTNPTDNSGNVGNLGSADLSADFDAQTVDADLSLSFDSTDQNWDASADDVDINSDATFDGVFDSVTVSDSAGGSVDGSGSLSGFFTGDDNGDINGAGMGYVLDDASSGTTVSGTAAFERDD